MFRDFIRAFGVRWFVAMSGGLGVPLTAAGVFYGPTVVKVVFFVTAIFCAVFSSFWVWRVEHEARIKAENLGGDPKLRMNIDSKMKAVSSASKSELYRLANGSIGLHQLDNAVQIELGEANLLTPKYAHDPAKFNEHWPLIKQWLEQNPQ
jgi:hypothetical protein